MCKPRFARWGMILIAGLVVPDGRAEDLGGGGRPLDGKTVSLRLMLGVGDTRSENWNGEVTLDRGEVVGIEGWRFREGDLVEGTRGWQAQTRRVRHKPVVAENAEAARLRPDRVGPSVVPTGVVVTVAAPPDAVLTVRTEQGAFAVALADLSAGATRRYLGGKVEAQRVADAIPLRDGPGQQDFPAAAADAQGAVWVAYVDHAPRGPEVLEALTQRPRNFSDFIPREGGDQIRLIRFTGGKAVAADRRDRARPGCLAARRGGRCRGPGRRRLVREPGGQLGPVQPPLRSERAVLVGDHAADERTGHRLGRRPGRRARGPGLDGLARLGRRPGRHLRGPARRARPRGEPERHARPMNGRRRFWSIASGRRACRLRHVPGGQLRRHPAEPRGRRYAGPDGDRRGVRPVRGAAEPGGRLPRADLGRLRGADRALGQGRQRPGQRATARPSTAPVLCGCAASTAAACSMRPTRSPTPPSPCGR